MFTFVLLTPNMKVFWFVVVLPALTETYAQEVLVPAVPNTKPTTSFLPTDTAAADAAYAAAALALYHAHDPPVSATSAVGPPAGPANPRAGPPLSQLSSVGGGAQDLRFTPDFAGSVSSVGAPPLPTGPRRGPPGHSRRGNPHGGHPHAGNSGKPGRNG